MADSADFKAPLNGVESERHSSSRAFKVGIALLGGSCLLFLSVVAVSAYGPNFYNTTEPESTNLFAQPGLRSRPAVPSHIAKLAAQLPGPSPWKELGLAAVENMNRCGVDRDMSTNANNPVRAVMASLTPPLRVQAETAIATTFKQAETAIVKKGTDIKAGQMAPMGYFDPLGFSAKAGPGKLLYLREAEIKHGRICMLASVGYLYGEIFHPFFGGELNVQSYRVALPEVYDTVGMGTFWLALFIACAGFEGIYSAPTLAGFGEMKEAKRVPGDLGFDPLNLKELGIGSNFLDLQNKELANGRLAMLAWAGMVGQELATGKTLFPALEEFRGGR